MINLKEKTIQQTDRTYPITRFEVWFRTPTGLCRNLELAIECCERDDFDPQLAIVAVPVACGHDFIYEELVR